MRDIRFRGLTDEKKWVYGYLHQRLISTDEVTFCIQEKPGTDIEVIPESIGQFTGLRDKNGVEVYEGDIIRFTWEEDSCWGKQGTYTAYIRFDKGTFEVVYIGKKHLIEGGNQTGSDELKYFMDWSEDVEVVGNIYENPELLKKLKEGE